MTKDRATAIKYELERMERLCLRNEGDSVQVRLIQHMIEIIDTLPIAKEDA